MAGPNAPEACSQGNEGKQKTALSESSYPLGGEQQDRFQDVTLNRPSGLPIPRRDEPDWLSSGETRCLKGISAMDGMTLVFCETEVRCEGFDFSLATSSLAWF